MSVINNYGPGLFCWVDLVAHDMSRAKDFYTKLFGWSYQEQPTHGGPPYGMFFQGEHSVAGLGQMSDEMKNQGVPAMWNNYVSVEDVEATAEKVKALGGTVTVPPMKVMDAGWLAFFTDPNGASFAVWKAGQHCGTTLVNEPHSLSWNECMSRGVEKVLPFYRELFGWQIDEFQSPGGPTIFGIKKDGHDNGHFMEMPEAVPPQVPSVWTPYFAVGDCDATLAQATELGGKVVVPAMDIQPGRFGMLHDPDGAAFYVIKLHPMG